MNSQLFDLKRNLIRHFPSCDQYRNHETFQSVREILAHVHETPRAVISVPWRDGFFGLTTVSDKFHSCVFSRLANENIKTKSKRENNFFFEYNPKRSSLAERKCSWFCLFRLNFIISCNDDSHRCLQCGFWHFFSFAPLVDFPTELRRRMFLYNGSKESSRVGGSRMA